MTDWLSDWMHEHPNNISDLFIHYEQNFLLSLVSKKAFIICIAKFSAIELPPRLVTTVLRSHSMAWIVWGAISRLWSCRQQGDKLNQQLVLLKLKLTLLLLLSLSNSNNSNNYCYLIQFGANPWCYTIDQNRASKPTNPIIRGPSSWISFATPIDCYNIQSKPISTRVLCIRPTKPDFSSQIGQFSTIETRHPEAWIWEREEGERNFIETWRGVCWLVCLFSIESASFRAILSRHQAAQQTQQTHPLSLCCIALM